MTDDTTDKTVGNWQVAGPPSTVVLTVVAELRDTDAMSLCPLTETIDADALNALFGTAPDANLSVTFEYEGCVVTVAGDGTVVAREP